MSTADSGQSTIPPTPAEAARLRGLGFNIIPIRRGTKMFRGGPDDIAKWKSGGCDATVFSSDSIAMLHGEVGGTWALDCDDGNILEGLLKALYGDDPHKACVVRTPKCGHHVIFKRHAEDAPPGDLSYSDGNGRRIDVKSVGYTLLPPSVHPDRSLGRYEYLFETTAPDRNVRWKEAVELLRGLGFLPVAGGRG